MKFPTKNTRRHGRSIAAVVAALGLASAAYAFTIDTDAGGTMTDIKNSAGTVVGKKMSIKQRTSTVPGRAEFRGESTRSTAVASGRFTLKSGGNYVSLIQSLNVVEAGKTSGSSEPITQLAIRPNGTAGQWEFYVVQGSQKCTGAPTVRKDVEYVVKITISLGASPLYEIKENKAGATFVKCQKANPDGDVGGTVFNGGSLKSGRYFYPKLGAYNTTSNQTQNGGSSVVEWRGINIK